MITKKELAEIKEHKKVNLYYAEKEYLQYIFLNAISRFGGKFVFKGGTCLRICYGLERASEDLDFSSNLKINEIEKIIQICLKDFELLNISFRVHSKKEYQGNIRFEIKFHGPLYNGDENSANTLKIDFNKNKVFNKNVQVIPKLFSDVPLFTLVCLAEKEILAEKIRALINRKESRDMYDLWILIKKGVEINKDLIQKKLREEKSILSKLEFPTRSDYELGLKGLTLNLPDYDSVKEVIVKFVKDLK